LTGDEGFDWPAIAAATPKKKTRKRVPQSFVDFIIDVPPVSI